MASDRATLTAGFLEHQRAVLPYSADIRDVPTVEFIAARYWSDDTISLLALGQDLDRAGKTVRSGSRGWIFYRPPGAPPDSPPLAMGPSDSAPPPPGSQVVGTHFISAEGVVVKRADPESPSGFSYVLSLRPGSEVTTPSYLVRTGSMFVDGDRAWVHEELVFVLTTDDLRAGLAPQLSFRAGISFSFVHGYAAYSLPLDQALDEQHLFEPGTGFAAPGPVPRPGQPIIYAVSKASGAYKYASNLVLAYDPVTTEREIAILRGVV